MKVRKVTRTESGSRLVNLRGFIPDEWQYVEVEVVKKKSDTVILEISVLRVEEVAPQVPQKAS